MGEERYHQHEDQQFYDAKAKYDQVFAPENVFRIDGKQKKRGQALALKAERIIGKLVERE